jgi:hypothetical protein
MQEKRGNYVARYISKSVLHSVPLYMHALYLARTRGTLTRTGAGKPLKFHLPANWVRVPPPWMPCCYTRMRWRRARMSRSSFHSLRGLDHQEPIFYNDHGGQMNMN